MSNDSRPSPTAEKFKVAASNSVSDGLAVYAEIYQTLRPGYEMSKAEKHRHIVDDLKPSTENEISVINLARRSLDLQ